jgi:RNA polymerase sigma-70 factor, ECF subfamily
MIQEEDETLLVLLVQRGDIAAFEKLLRRLHAPLRKYVTNLVGDSTADDVLQEVSLRIYRQIRQLREPKVFRAWAFRIATRISFVHLKRAKRWREMESDPELIRSFPTSTVPQQEELDAEFLSLVDRVSPASRAVLLLHYQQHLSLEETAAILDIPLGTAKSRLSYGVATIRNFVMEKEKR